MPGGEAENAEHRERESDLEKNGMEEPLQKATQNAHRIHRGGMNLHTGPTPADPNPHPRAGARPWRGRGVAR
jgi:hypothetical protein